MTKAELESKHIAELHALAAEAGVSGYRMLRREELIEALAGGKPDGDGKPARERPRRERGERPRRRRERGGRPAAKPERGERPERSERAAKPKPKPEPAAKPGPAPAAKGPAPERPRRRRRFGRRRKGLGVTDLLLPPPGRQALVYGESRESCTALLREVAAEISGTSKGPDPIALLVDPAPEELAEWKREAPKAEIVAAATARHAGDALAQAANRAEAGEDVVLLVDSLTKLEDAGTAQKIFDATLAQAKGSLTVVAALERRS